MRCLQFGSFIKHYLGLTIFKNYQFSVYECFACMHVHHIHACLVLQRSEEGVASSRPGVTMAVSVHVGARTWAFSLIKADLLDYECSSHSRKGEDCHEFQDSLGYLMRPGLNYNKKERGWFFFLLTRINLKTKQKFMPRVTNIVANYDYICAKVEEIHLFRTNSWRFYAQQV